MTIRVRFHGAGYDEPLELELVDDATGRTYTHGLTIAQADAVLHELRTRILQARNTPPPDNRRLPYVE